MDRKRYCFALDLKDDPEIIERYIAHHRSVAPEIIRSITDADIQVMDIYQTGNRLFMIMEVGEDFSFERKAQMDNENPKVQEWESLMGTLQQSLPWAKPGEKWVLMDQIFHL
ncbi:MAG: L-rhamnose mutarotase [Lunatimonas sp.]|uniref:L-rhamnose mutarotase n=1 Tax=Lunatimonas sp. TaxID=2060141 RepID=UPI00263A4669|nr:L-rhamnose mutarotase [Lunatimonas sp.]MCC5936598.1 L-rhamnose mutarotase [Lunatimonas sp.]